MGSAWIILGCRCPVMLFSTQFLKCLMAAPWTSQDKCSCTSRLGRVQWASHFGGYVTAGLEFTSETPFQPQIFPIKISLLASAYQLFLHSHTSRQVSAPQKCERALPSDFGVGGKCFSVVVLQMLFVGFQQSQKSNGKSSSPGEHPLITACSPWATSLG